MERAEKESPLAGNGCDTIAKSARLKTWGECGIEEKVERLRHELRDARNTASYAARNAGEAQRIASTHIHGELGQVAIPAESRGGQMGLQGDTEGRGYDPLR